MADCIFCDIAQGKARAKIVLETEEFIAFENISPKAPVHVMAIPKRHLLKKDVITGKEPGFWGKMMGFVNKVIEEFDLDKTGYQLVNNGAGYNHIEHEHFHVLGGKGWKPTLNL